MKKARTLFCSTRSQTHSPSESYARWRRLKPLGFARRQRPPCKRDADPSGLKADREGDHVANVLGWLRMRQAKTYWHRNTARSEFRAEPQQPGPAYGACPCRNLHHYSHAHRSMEAYFAGAASCSAQTCPSTMPSISQTQRTKAVIGARLNIHPTTFRRSAPLPVIGDLHSNLQSHAIGHDWPIGLAGKVASLESQKIVASF